MSDTDPTGPEEERLRGLLHRAAASLEVTAPEQLTIEPAPTPARVRGRGRTSGRWLVAAAMLAVAAVGGAWWLSAGDEDRLDTGPAEPPVTVAPEVLEQAGIGRLPEGLDGYRVVAAMDGGSYDTSSSDHPGVLAVDDPDDPQRWLMVEAYDQWGVDPPGSRPIPISEEVTAVLIPAGQSIWFQMTPTTGPDDNVVSGAVRGMEEEQLLDLLTRHFGDALTLAEAGTSTGAMEAMLRDSSLDGENALVRQGREAGDPGGGSRNIEVTLIGDDETEVTVTVAPGGLPAWAVVMQLELTAELFSMELQSSPGASMTVNRRPDLGTNVIESGVEGVEMGPGRGIAVVTDDGVMITASSAGWAQQAAAGTVGATPPTITPLGEDDQLRIINSLRAMSEIEFRAQLAELGIGFIEPSSPDDTVTTVQGD